MSDEDLTPEQKKKLKRALQAEAAGQLPKRSERVSALEEIRKKIKKNGSSADADGSGNN